MEDKVKEPYAAEVAALRQRITELEQILEISREVNHTERLEERVRERTAELQARNEELTAYGHTVAHDLKAPLTLVIGYADLLKEDYTTLSGAEVQKYLQTIAQHGHKMRSIIDELMLLAGLHDMPIELKPLDMAHIVTETRWRLASMIEEARAEIILPKAWPGASGYGPWVEEVWVNYLSNAIKYGGRPPRLELGAREQANGLVRFWVQDNGSGIPPETQPQLFSRFMRLDPQRAQGHGLGLSIVRHIVEKLGGQVDVESKVGQGSCFAFSLPATGHRSQSLSRSRVDYVLADSPHIDQRCYRESEGRSTVNRVDQNSAGLGLADWRTEPRARLDLADSVAVLN